MADIFNMADTWNDAGTTFDAIKLDVTDTASNSLSRLLNLTVGGAARFSVRKSGDVLVAGGVWAAGSAVNGNGPALASAGVIIPSTSYLSWGDAFIYRFAANHVTQRNGVNAQTFSVFETYTNTTNYSRLSLAASATAHRIQAEALGTGTVRIIAIDAFSKAGAAVAADIPAGTWGLVRDTSGGTTKLVYNNGGTLESVTLS